MRNRGWLSVVVLVLSMAAVVISHELLDKHLTGSSGSAWFEAGCGDTDDKGGSDCAAVLASPYSYWPPKKENEPEGTFHVPIAFVGLLYYSALAVWFLCIGRPSPERRWLHLLLMGLVGLGLVASAYFTFIMFTKLNEWCPWCLATHILNVGIAICVVLLWPGKAPPPAAADAATTMAEPPAPGSPAVGGPYPSHRLVLVTVLAIAFVLFAEDQMAGRKRYYEVALANKRTIDQCVDAIKRLTVDMGTVVRNWNNSARYSIAIRPDDPFRLGRSDVKTPLVAVVFSDFQCPSCKRLAGFLPTRIEPLFNGYLKTVFKHYPLNTDCNPVTTTHKHKYACEAAMLAEAAHVLGGNEAFWRAHDFLFANQDRLANGRLTAEDVAAAVGLDSEQLRKVAASKEVLNRIRDDTQHARTYGVRGTPSLFVAGRRVDSTQVRNLAFWERIAEQYRIALGGSGPVHAKPAAGAKRKAPTSGK